MLTTKPATIPVQYLRGQTFSCSQPPRRNYDEIHRRFYNISTKSQKSESVLLRSSADSILDKPIQKEMSGTDVLWAIQRATAQRKKRSNVDRRKKKITSVELSSSTGESTGDNGVVAYSNVKPLRIKSDWGNKLDEFEKLLKEFQDTEL